MDIRTETDCNLQQHVLEIDLVLDAILGYLTDIEYIKVFRLVCRRWNEAALQIIKRKFSVRIVFESQQPNTQDTDNKWIQRCSQYLAFLKETNVPKLIFSYVIFDNISVNNEQVQELLTSFGHTIQKLELKCGKDHIDSAIFGSLLLAQCPNLEELIIVPSYLSKKFFTGRFRQPDDNRTNTNIKKLDIHYDFGSNNSTEFIEDLFTACPNVEKALCHYLQFDAAISKGLSYSAHWIRKGMFDMMFLLEDFDLDFLEAIQRSPCLGNIRELTLSLVDDKTAKYLNSHEILGKLKLKSLKIIYLKSVRLNLGPLFQGFLESQANTLEELIICSWQGIRTDQTNIFPAIMPKLKMLQVGILEGVNIFPSMNVHVNFPALETLILNGKTTAYLFLAETVSDKHLGLKNLKLYDGTKALTMTKAAFLFPNVVEVAVANISLESIAIIWKHCSQLQILHVGLLDTSDDLTDAITGVTINQWASAAKFIRKSEMYDAFPFAPSITGLKSLKTLSVTAPISDFCFHHSFSKMANLQYVGIEAKNIKISPGAIRAFCSENSNRVVDLKPYHENFQNEKSVFNFYKRHPLLLQEFNNLKR